LPASALPGARPRAKGDFQSISGCAVNTALASAGLTSHAPAPTFFVQFARLPDDQSEEVARVIGRRLNDAINRVAIYYQHESGHELENLPASVGGVRATANSCCGITGPPT
jgi:hypothetical protein